MISLSVARWPRASGSFSSEEGYARARAPSPDVPHAFRLSTFGCHRTRQLQVVATKSSRNKKWSQRAPCALTALWTRSPILFRLDLPPRAHVCLVNARTCPALDERRSRTLCLPSPTTLAEPRTSTTPSTSRPLPPRRTENIMLARHAQRAVKVIRPCAPKIRRHRPHPFPSSLHSHL